MKNHPAILFLIICLLWSCTGRETRRYLSEAEALLGTRPDSALSILERIDSLGIHGNKAKARYRLTMGIALDKNNIDNGSWLYQMEQAEQWYGLYGQEKKHLLALYYLADQQQDSGDQSSALINFERALDLAEEQEDWFYCGMSARAIAAIYGKEYDAEQELRHISQACNYFRASGHTVHYAHSRIRLAKAHIDNHDYRSAVNICDELIENRNCNATIKADALSVSAIAYLLMSPPEPDSTIVRLDRYRTLGYELDGYLLSRLAVAKNMVGDRKESREYLEQAYSKATDKADSMRIAYAELLIEKYERKDRETLEDKFQNWINEETIRTLRQSASKVQVNYYKASGESAEKQKEINRLRFSLAILSLLIAASIVILVLSRRIKEKNLKIEKTETALSDAGARIKAQNSKISDFISLGLQNIPDKEQGKVKETLIPLIDAAIGGAVTKLGQEMPKLSKEEQAIFAYLAIDLPYPVIQDLTGIGNNAYLRTKVSRLRNKISRSSIPDKEMFLSYMPRRSRSINNR